MPVTIVRAQCRFDAVSHLEKDDTFYTVADDEFIESADPLPGETAPGLGHSDVEEIPVRLLDDFIIYDRDTLRLVPIAHLLDLRPGMHYGASGLVRPWTNDSMDDEDDSVLPLVINLSPILELDIHYFTPSTGSLDE